VGKKATASNVFRNNQQRHGADKACDDDPDTRWATDAGTHQAWLEVDLGEPLTIDRAVIDEAYPGRVQEFEVQAKLRDTWQTITRGKQIRSDLLLKFAPVRAQVFRLNILEAKEAPTISEFQLFEAKK
jgi:alpha-L-fucosidase